MLLKQIGEYKLHAWMKRNLPGSAVNIVGIGDDCAVLDLLDDKYLLMSTDKVPARLSGSYAGKFCVIANYADIVCMGGTPVGLLINMCLPRSEKFGEVKKILNGAITEANKYHTSILGGDIKESNTYVITGTAAGTVPKEQLITRKGARIGNYVALTLTNGKKLGARWCYILQEFYRLKMPRRIVKELKDKYVEYLKIPYREMQAAVKVGGITSCMDASDGLGGCLKILAELNKVGIRIFEGAIEPYFDPVVYVFADRLNQPLLKFAFAPGYDWENVCTVKKSHFPALRNAILKEGGDLIKIGEVTKKRKITVTLSNGTVEKLNIFTDEKFKKQAWTNQPKAWTSFSLLERGRPF